MEPALWALPSYRTGASTHAPTPLLRTTMLRPTTRLVLAFAALAVDGQIAAAAAAVEGECDASDGSCDAASGAVANGRRTTTKCEDAEPECGKWAEVGECDNNPNYMKRE